MKMKTKLIHAGIDGDPHTGAVNVPIYQVSTYKQEGVGQHKGYEYSRTGNPTRFACEELIKDIEFGVRGFAFSSGMAAMSAVVMLFNQGDHFIVGDDVYGGTFRVLDKVFNRFGIEVTFVNTSNLEEVKSAVKENTKALFLETPSNPLLKVSDIPAINDAAQKHNTTIPIMIKIDSGLHRCGLVPDPDIVTTFVSKMQLFKHLICEGIMTHAGHAYGASTPEEAEQIGYEEGTIMVELAKYIRYMDQEPKLNVSVGATPTVRVSGTISGVSEIRPGNYVFNDKTQVMLGSAKWENCALRVLSRVVSHPAQGRWVIDAGAKTLALDQGAHGKSGIQGFGEVVGYPSLNITRLSEEHGVLEGEESLELNIGDIIEIIPNHACPVVNLANQLLVIEESQSITNMKQWNIAGRGCNY